MPSTHPSDGAHADFAVLMFHNEYRDETRQSKTQPGVKKTDSKRKSFSHKSSSRFRICGLDKTESKLPVKQHPQIQRTRNKNQRKKEEERKKEKNSKNKTNNQEASDT